MFEAVKFYPKPPRTYELFLAARAPVKFTPADFFHADGGTASRALLPVAHIHIVCVIRPRLSFRDAGTILLLGGNDSAHTHINGEQMLIIVSQAAQLIITECLPGA